MPKLLIFFATIAVLMLLVYFVMAPIFHPEFVNRIAFYPGPEEENAEQYRKIGEVQGQRMMIAVNSSNGAREISALYFKKPDAKYATIFSHGNAGSMIGRNWKTGCLLEAGSSVLIYDYAGFGRSPGHPSMEVVTADGLAAYDYLQKVLHWRPDQIVLYGESIGGGVTSEIARQRLTCGLILDSTFLSPAIWAKSRIPLLRIYPDAFLISPSLNVRALFPAYKGALLVIKPGHDDVIPTSHSDELFACAAGPKQLVTLPQSPHGIVLAPDSKIYAEAVKKFFTGMKSL